MLELLIARGDVAIAGRVGRERLWDLASRVYPDDVVLPFEQARTARDARRLTALGIARSRGAKAPVEPVDAERPASPRSSRAYGASGRSTRRSWDSRSPGARRCCRRSTASCTTASA
jgi:hypothetical protein